MFKEIMKLMGNKYPQPFTDSDSERSEGSDSEENDGTTAIDTISIISNPLYNSGLALTENSDKAYATTGSKCLDFFTRITRNAPVVDYVKSFFDCVTEDYDTAFKILFNLRDIRGGKGEKLIPIVLMVCLKNTLEPDVYQCILAKYIEYGCWKDLLRIVEINNRVHLEMDPTKLVTDTDNYPEFKMFADQLLEDYELFQNADLSQPKKVSISLCAKWAPSEKTHFNQPPVCAMNQIRKLMKISPKAYRLMLSQLRAHLNVLERLMSTGQTELIDFGKVPSIAMMKMKKAFDRDTNAIGICSESRLTLHQSYQSYLKDLSAGKAKVNTKGIQPHELVSTYLHKSNVAPDPLVEAQWESLVGGVRETGTFKNTIAIVDTSGSMRGQPIQVSVAMGILVAECTESAEKKVITFSENPRWNYLAGSNLKEKVASMDYSDWGGSTNMRKVFDLILSDGIMNNLQPSQMVDTLIIFTDMQFDSACGHSDKWETTFEYAKNLFESHGYELPRIVCWNLRTSNSKTLPVAKDEKGYAMLSGFSSELLKHVLNGQALTPYAMMSHVLEPYDNIINQNWIQLADYPFDLDQLDKAIKASTFKKAYKQTTYEKI
jgi:hypothetical protein